jgi:hypothetical protein
MLPEPEEGLGNGGRAWMREYPAARPWGRLWPGACAWRARVLGERRWVLLLLWWWWWSRSSGLAVEVVLGPMVEVVLLEGMGRVVWGCWGWR